MALPLRAIVVFDVVARCRSLSKAAQELHVTPSAVSQQIQALENVVGRVRELLLPPAAQLQAA